MCILLRALKRHLFSPLPKEAAWKEIRIWTKVQERRCAGASWALLKDEAEMLQTRRRKRHSRQRVCLGIKVTLWSRCNGYEFEDTPGDSEEQGTGCAAVHGAAKGWT